MIVVTGAAGFIGSCIVGALNQRSVEDLLLVDHINELKSKNIAHKKYEQYYEKDQFLEMVKNDSLKDNISAVIHMGACSSTTLNDANYYEQNNFQYTKALAQWAVQRGIRFIYASSAATYGNGSCGYKDDIQTIYQCKPLNLYGLSKQKFDLFVLENNLLNKVVGLKFFNVFGPNEYHKADMRSVVAKAYKNVAEQGVMSLFKSYKTGYADGEQKRDFIYVKDAVDVVLYFLDNDLTGIFNVGTGLARSWNDLAAALFKAVGKELNIEYVDMPETLKKKYQYFTQANMAKLLQLGYKKDFFSLEDSVSDYVGYLKADSYL